MLRVRRREKKSRGKKDAEQLLKVRREKKSWVIMDAEQLLELKEEQRRVEGTRTQRICLEQEEI